jgi:hypothetical protein
MTLSTDALAFNAAASAADAPAALAEPVMPVRKRFIGLLTLANLGFYTGLFATMNPMLPRQIELISSGQKEATLALVSGLGALAAVLANPLVGAFSDRTTSRFVAGMYGR